MWKGLGFVWSFLFVLFVYNLVCEESGGNVVVCGDS